jgi:hypothetical protein
MGAARGEAKAQDLRAAAIALDARLYSRMWNDIYREYPYEAEAQALHRALGCDIPTLHPPHAFAADVPTDARAARSKR